MKPFGQSRHRRIRLRILNLWRDIRIGSHDSAHQSGKLATGNRFGAGLQATKHGLAASVVWLIRHFYRTLRRGL